MLSQNSNFSNVFIMDIFVVKCCYILFMFTDSLQRNAWTSLHVRQSLLISRLRPLLPGQSRYVTHGIIKSLKFFFVHPKLAFKNYNMNMILGLILYSRYCYSSCWCVILASCPLPAAPEHMLCLQNGRYDNADRMFNRYFISVVTYREILRP